MLPYRERDEAPGEAAHPALALANSHRNSPGGPVDELSSAASLRAWLRDHGFAAPRQSASADLAAFRDLRDAVRELLLARIEGRLAEPRAVAFVNRTAREAPTAPQLHWDVAGPREAPGRTWARGLALVRATVAADAIELILGPEHDDLRICGAPGCVRLLLRDHPRRQWCSTRCGDRVRASRYYHRHRAAGNEQPAL